MMRHLAILTALMLALAPLENACATDEQAMPNWLTGVWVNSEGDNWGEEFWTSARAGIMFGANRSGKGETLQFWEHMRIVREEDGQLVFWAISGDQKPVRFAATKVSADSITFENPKHDYPQRITYWRDGKILRALISLADRSQPRGFAFELKLDN
ncbi:DUF6265 family protein [Sphingorhabdus sp.]|uniref:DUF6265 family protein n=1 Tax=Sphingorhabdus sp. TaxID=1902408 RepID=UPI0035941C1A